MVRDVQVFGRMDPFCLFHIGGEEKLKTITNKDGATNPIWNQTVTHEVKNMSEEVKLEVFSERMFSNEIVGSGNFSIADFCHEGEISYSISHEEEQAG